MNVNAVHLVPAFRPPLRILLQTTIERAEDDWHIGRFSMLRQHLEALRTAGDEALCVVTARDRDAGADDPVLSRLPDGPFDQIWIFAADHGDGLTALECDALYGFHERGGGILTARDHEDLGSSLRDVRCVGPIEHFHSYQPEEDKARRQADDRNSGISWPNYHSGSNGDLQGIIPIEPIHPLLFRDGRSEAGGIIGRFPAHPHEGAIESPPGNPAARVVAEGRSTFSGRPFNLIVAAERTADTAGRMHGRILAHSSFHHFCDYNWDPGTGAPSFVDDPPGTEIAADARALEDIKAYVRNAVCWLSGTPSSE